MQQIIAMIMDNGKEAYLAKIPIVLGSCSSCTPYPNPETGAQNIIIRKYNQVIDELVLENGILTIPPDFYLHFSQNMDQFFDNYHPNGDGYNSMAELWFNSLTQ
jgi:lysophospholipase L1-like esterase